MNNSYFKSFSWTTKSLLTPALVNAMNVLKSFLEALTLSLPSQTKQLIITLTPPITAFLASAALRSCSNFSVDNRNVTPLVDGLVKSAGFNFSSD